MEAEDDQLDNTRRSWGSPYEFPFAEEFQSLSPLPRAEYGGSFDKRFSTSVQYAQHATMRAITPSLRHIDSTQMPLLRRKDSELSDRQDTTILWDQIRWTKLHRLTEIVFSESGRRSFGYPACLSVSSVIVIGTSKGIVLVFDYHQMLKASIGFGTKAVECGSVTSVALSADHTTIASGHSDGSIFTWEIERPDKPFLQISPISMLQYGTSRLDGHVKDVSIIHIGFLGTRHTALVSADDRGMAFSHLASRGMGAISRTVQTARLLGRYPSSEGLRSVKRPSTVLAFAPLPLGNTESATDALGLVAILTPYILVVVSTMPVAQTQHKASRPREMSSHSALSAALSWCPAIKISQIEDRNPMLAYSWFDVISILEVVELDDISGASGSRPSEFEYRFKNRWRLSEPIVSIQWLNYSVLALVTITQQLLVLDASTGQITDSSDLLRKHIYHTDFFSAQLDQVEEASDTEDASLHGVVADAFYMSIRAYKGRIFLLGYNDICLGTLSNWADRILAVMGDGDFVGAIELATTYYRDGDGRSSLGLPDDQDIRQKLVGRRLIEMMSASLKYALFQDGGELRIGQHQLAKLTTACFNACLVLKDMDFLFDHMFDWYLTSEKLTLYSNCLETFILEDRIDTIPPIVMKHLVNDFVNRNDSEKLEILLCQLNPVTMDLDQVLSLCKTNGLYEALFYIWSQGIGDFVAILEIYPEFVDDQDTTENNIAFNEKLYSYLTYSLTNRSYPTGDMMDDRTSMKAKTDIYYYMFSSSTTITSPEDRFSHLRRIIALDPFNFFRMLNEAFEDPFLNSEIVPQDFQREDLDEKTRFCLSLNRQYIVRVLLQVVMRPDFDEEVLLYLDIFLARNLAKYPQFLLLPGGFIHRIMLELCSYPENMLREDRQLSIEYLLSVFQPTDVSSIMPKLATSRFYRVMKNIYRTQGDYSMVIYTCFQDLADQAALFDCITQYLGHASSLDADERNNIKQVIIQHTSLLVHTNLAELAKVFETCAPELHEHVLFALDNNSAGQFNYLDSIMEPKSLSIGSVNHSQKYKFIETYTRLLCTFNAAHVAEYIDHLQDIDSSFPWQKILPILENEAMIDAVVMLLAKVCRFHEANDRLLAHLTTLSASLHNLLLEKPGSSEFYEHSSEANDLVDSLEKYCSIGVWLCQRHTDFEPHTQDFHMSTEVNIKSAQDTAIQSLTSSESSWLAFIEQVVRIVQDPKMIGPIDSPNVHESSTSFTGDSPPIEIDHQSSLLSNLTQRLQNMVQGTFSSMLNETGAASYPSNMQSGASFLRILRAFLSQASDAFSALVYLRSILCTVFSSYSYEEESLDLAIRLLDKDLYLHVQAITECRRRGWRPLGQVCGICDTRIWGPGIGLTAWDSWLAKSKVNFTTNPAMVEMNCISSIPKGKAKADRDGAADTVSDDSIGIPTIEESISNRESRTLESIIVFSCRHLFHHGCLTTVKNESMSELGELLDESTKLKIQTCPLEA